MTNQLEKMQQDEKQKLEKQKEKVRKTSLISAPIFIFPREKWLMRKLWRKMG